MRPQTRGICGISSPAFKTNSFRVATPGSVLKRQVRGERSGVYVESGGIEMRDICV